MIAAASTSLLLLNRGGRGAGLPTHGGRCGWIVVAQTSQLKVGPARMIVARLAFAFGGALLIIATKRGRVG